MDYSAIRRGSTPIRSVTCGCSSHTPCRPSSCCLVRTTLLCLSLYRSPSHHVSHAHGPTVPDNSHSECLCCMLKGEWTKSTATTYDTPHEMEKGRRERCEWREQRENMKTITKLATRTENQHNETDHAPLCTTSTLQQFKTTTTTITKADSLLQIIIPFALSSIIIFCHYSSFLVLVTLLAISLTTLSLSLALSFCVLCLTLFIASVRFVIIVTCSTHAHTPPFDDYGYD